MFGLANKLRHLPSHGRKTLARCQEGVTAVEFAMIAPVFMIMVMGIIELSLMMFTSAVMESATGNTSRLGKTGYIPDGVSRSDAILANIRDRTAGLLNPDNITISSEAYSDFNNVGQPEPYIDTNHNGGYEVGETYTDINGNGHWDADMGQEGLGNAGDVVVYTVSYPWPVMTPIISSITGSIVTINARTVVKNEPYDVGS